MTSTKDAIIVTSVTGVSYLLLYTMYSKQKKALDLDTLLDVILVRKGNSFSARMDHTLVEVRRVGLLSAILKQTLSGLPGRQVNKAASLTGLTVLTLAFCPKFEGIQRDLIWHSLLILWPHSIYSAYKFYGTPNIPKLSTWPAVVSEMTSSEAQKRAAAVKKLSIVVGVAGQLVLWQGRLRQQTRLSPVVLTWRLATVIGYKGRISATALGLASVSLGVIHFYTMEIDYKRVLQVRPYAYLPFPLAAIAIGYLVAKTASSA
jgi:hypothetical protein